MIQNHALQDRQRLVLDNLDKKPIIILIDTGSSIGLLDEQLYYSLSSVPPLQPIPFSVSEEDDRPLIALGKTFISIAINDDTFRVQLIVTRNILFTVVLGIGFLKTHGGVISFSTNQLYLTNPSPKPNESPISTNNPYTPPMHTPNTYHPHSRTCVQPNQPCHIINIGPVTIPPRTNTIMTIPCALPRSISVHYTPVIINALKITTYQCILSTTVTKRLLSPCSYVGAMEKVQESDQDMYHADTSHADLVLLILPVPPLSNTILILTMLNP